MNHAKAIAAMEPAVGPDAVRCGQIVDAVEGVFRGNREVVQMVLAAVLARGHVLFEDVPGVGKTTLARAFAHVLGLSHRRIQFASDLMPADIVGVGIYDQGSRRFEFKPGPVFCNVLLADEINRTTPRTQSALLEAMAEGHVTVDGHTHVLPHPFVVLATQNPREFHGTYPLPESQLDRFLLRLSVGYPGPEVERELIRSLGAPTSLDDVPVVTDGEALSALATAADRVHVSDEVLDYLHRLARATRESRRLELGLSTRGAIGLFQAVKARALIAGRTFATPDDVRQMLVPVAAHRILPAGHGGGMPIERSQMETTLQGIIESVAPPQ